MATNHPMGQGRREWREHIPSPKGTTQRIYISILFIYHSPELGVMAPKGRLETLGFIPGSHTISSYYGKKEHILMGNCQFLPQFPILEEGYFIVNNTHTRTHLKAHVPSTSCYITILVKSIFDVCIMKYYLQLNHILYFLSHTS